MPKIEPKDKRLTEITSLALGLVMVVASLASVFLFSGQKLPLTWDQLLVAGMTIAIFPAAAVEYLDLRWQRGIDKNIPRLLREIAESGQTGLTLVRAIEVSADRDYGPLTPELKHLIGQISWGISLEDAMHDFGKRARTKLAQRTAVLISEVSRAGGDTQKIMEQLNKHIGELQAIDRERYAEMRPYAVVVYIAFVVFLFTDIMLIRSFFDQIIELQKSVLATSGGGGVFGGVTSVNVEMLKTVLFHAAVIQAFLGGLMAGKMSEAKMGAGLKHIVVLLLIAFLAFYFFVWNV